MALKSLCPGEYIWYVCTLPLYEGCCSVDACLTGFGCPVSREYPDPFGSSTILTKTLTRVLTLPVDDPSSFTILTSIDIQTLTQPTEVAQFSLSTFSSPISTSAGASPTSKTSSTQQSATASPTRPGGATFGPSSLLFIIAILIGGALVIVIIILTIILCRRRRRRRESRNPAEGLPTHGGVPEPFLDDGPVRAERAGFLALFKRTHPIPAAEATTVPTSSSTTFPERPSPSFPQPSQHNSPIPGLAELASPPISPVSELSPADRGVYSSTNVSTVSAGAVVSPTSHETLRGGSRPVMMPNVVSSRRERRKHALA